MLRIPASTLSLSHTQAHSVTLAFLSALAFIQNRLFGRKSDLVAGSRTGQKSKLWNRARAKNENQIYAHTCRHEIKKHISNEIIWTMDLHKKKKFFFVHFALLIWIVQAKKEKQKKISAEKYNLPKNTIFAYVCIQ